MIIARQSTARTVTVGPVLDADGAAVTDGVVGDFKISKNGGAPAALNGSATATHRHTGFYSLALTASDLDTVGQAEVTIDDTVNSMAQKELTVIEEAVYDILYAASATGAVPVSSGGITTASFAAGAINAAAIADGAIDAATFAGDVDKKFGIVDTGTAQSVAANEIVIRAGAAFVDNALVGCTVKIEDGTQIGSRALVTSNVGATDTLALSDWTGATPTGTPEYTIFGSAQGASLSDIAGAVLDKALASHTTAGSLGKAIADIESDATAILADSNELQTDWANGGRLDLILDARASQASVDDLPTNAELATSQAAADDATLAAIAAVDAKIDIIDTNVDQIETLLGETDTDVAAIKAKTDSLTFTEAGVVDANANVTHINDVEVTGDGALTPWGPA
jgi:hypothetical protein